MNTHRKTAIIVGILFIIATAFLFIGRAFYEPILSSPDYLEIAYPNRTLVIIGILLEFACVLAIPLIPICLFPILKTHHEALAIGYVVFRLFEAVLLSVAEIKKLSLVNISQSYLLNGAADASYFHHIGSAVQAENYWGDTGLMYSIVFILGALMLYAVLYQSRLIPCWISIWGILAAVTLFTGAVLSVFIDLSPAITAVLMVPIGVQEMVMAVWLIAKGFNTSVIVSARSRNEENDGDKHSNDTPDGQG